MFEQAFKNIDGVLRKEAGCTTELDYTEQPSWLLFLKYLDALEQDKADEAALEGKKYTFILDKRFRWEMWAAPKGKDVISSQPTGPGASMRPTFVSSAVGATSTEPPIPPEPRSTSCSRGCAMPLLPNACSARR